MVAGEEANAAMQQQQQPPLCCVMVPTLSMGHIIPMVDLGLLLAEQGVSVTLFTTRANAERLVPSVARAREACLPFTVTVLPFKADSLPEGMENSDLTTSASEFETLISELGQLESPLRDHLKGFDPSRTFMVSDFCQPWTRFVSSELGIRRYVFYSMPCFTLVCHRALMPYYDAGNAEDESEPFLVPGLPHRIQLTRAQAPGLYMDPEREGIEAGEASCDGIIVNTFAALEGEYLGLSEKEIAKPVWPVGPVALYNYVHAELAATRGDTPSVGAGQVLGWLDKQMPQSVVYVCLGSQVQTTAEQAVEIALGLEASGHPFVLVIRARGSRLAQLESWLGAGFEDRTKDRGLVIRGWAPQQLILSHAAIGGFLTHCGWNSISEAMAFGVPLATWPSLFDQFVNERFVVDVLGIGVAVGVKEPQWWWSEELTVERGRVEQVVRELMDTGEESEKRRARAREIGVEARKAMQVGKGESSQVLAALIQDADRRAGQKQGKV